MTITLKKWYVFSVSVKLWKVIKNIELGVIKIKLPFGNTIKFYNFERTICDIVKNENKCGLHIEQRNKIITLEINVL